MPNPVRTWQMISLVLAAVLIVTLVELHRSKGFHQPEADTLPKASNRQNYEHLALSPSARRAHERYSL